MRHAAAIERQRALAVVGAGMDDEKIDPLLAKHALEVGVMGVGIEPGGRARGVDDLHPALAGEAPVKAGPEPLAQRIAENHDGDGAARLGPARELGARRHRRRERQKDEEDEETHRTSSRMPDPDNER